METLELNSNVLKECLKASLPASAKDVTVLKINRIPEHGATSMLYSFLLTYYFSGAKEQKECVIKLYRDGSEDGFAEFTALKTLENHGLSVPIAYCLEVDNRKLGWPFLIMEKINGKRPSECIEDKRMFIEEMAKLLVRIHKLELPVVQQLDYLRERHKMERQNLQKFVFFIRNRCMSFLGFSPWRKRRFIAAVKKLEEVKQEKFRPVLLHMDYEPHHILVSEKGLSVFDWGDAAIGDPAYDVARTYHLLKLGRETSDIDLGEHFVESYEKYNCKKLANLPFWKDMFAIRLAIRYGLSPFAISRFLNYGLLVDLNFGYIYGRIQETRRLRHLQVLYTNHHTPLFSNFKHIQNYALNYLESGRYK